MSKLTNLISNIFNNQQTEQPQHLPVLRRMDVKKQYWLFTSLTIASAIGSLGLLSYISARNTQLNARIESSVNIQMLSQKLAKNIQKGIAGNEIAFKAINDDYSAYREYVKAYKVGNDKMNRLEDNLQSDLVTYLEKLNADLAPKVKLLNDNKKIIISVSKQSEDLESTIQGLIKDLDNIDLLMIQRGENTSKLVELQTLSRSVLSLSKNLGTAANSLQVDLKLVSDLNADFLAINSSMKNLLESEPIGDRYTLEQMKLLNTKYKDLFDSMPGLLQNIKPLIDGKKAGSETLSVFDKIYDKIDILENQSNLEKIGLEGLSYVVYLLALFTVAFIMLLGFTNLREAQILSWKTKKENEETDAAVIRLMEELIPISEGNLKARTTVTEHVTGALSDRINSMAESLQLAVQTTRSTSDAVSTQMTEVQTLVSEAYKLAKYAEGAAKKSNQASVLGSNMVNQAAEKMEDARNKMQETSKRVKRLGEVSQSIATVTDLIEEMTEKTAILALNTQLKSAESGSEGNSFRVIAEEIRKLSEEAKKSLSTIRSSVQSMQSETQTVMISIEQTTSNVVEGSVLWEKAEKDLQLIQEAAKQIELITQKLNELSSKQVIKAKETEANMDKLNNSISHFNV